ncbi:MAG: acyloxyacyl hydrolase [Bacteroidales bacterium]|nr:acyloxyacyl hydrolase [Bacteroidales bacterium]
MGKKITVLCLSLLISVITFSQTGKNFSYEIATGYGWVAPINDFVRGKNQDNTKINAMANLSFRFTKEVDGSKAWHYLYNGVYYGVGGFYGHFNYSKHLNNPFSLYGLFGFNVFHTQKFALKTEVALGLSGIWDGYSETNRYNVAVSTPVECYAHANMEGLYSFSDNWHINLGASFIHFSNGTMLRPNKGINVLTPILGLTYTPQKINHIQRKNIPEDLLQTLSYTPHWQSLVTLYYAQKGVYTFYKHPLQDGTMKEDTARGVYPIFGLQGRFMRKMTFSHSLGLGFDVSYNENIGKNSKYYYYPGHFNDSLSLYQRFTLSAFISYEYSINNFSIILDPGVYIYRHKDGYLPHFCQRIGLRYQLPKGIFAQLSLRAYDFRKADYIEWGVGYRIKHNFYKGKTRQVKNC